MQRNRRNVFRTDLRQPLVACAIIGFAAAVLVLGLANLLPEDQLLLYGGAAIGLYVLVVGVVVWAYLARYRRITLANDAARLMTTEIHDMFRYVMDIPYAIIDEHGTVKIVSGALQDLLKLRSPLCNVPVSSFCAVPMEDIVAYAKNGGPVHTVTVTEDGVPLDHTKPMMTDIDGKTYDMKCYPMRSRGKEYYFVVFQDVTEKLAMRKEAYETEPVVAYIVIDSLQELAQYIRVSYRTAVNEIEAKLKEWVAGFGGMLREYEREKYLLVFHRAALDKCIRNKFRILDTIRNIKLGDNTFPVTI
ncbi:MAG: hypothetical protein IIW78_00930, partial [Clostridia bacterium]|nr:hypothetical protein [Clostridia bacterium]